MRGSRNTSDPWKHMMGTLAHANDKSLTMPRPGRRRRRVSEPVAGIDYRPSAALIIELVERQSTSTVTLMWNDTVCRYGYQDWRLAATRKSGVCAMSGKPIKRGDLIYKPVSPTAALNAKSMILRDALDAAFERMVDARDCSILQSI